MQNMMIKFKIFLKNPSLLKIKIREIIVSRLIKINRKTWKFWEIFGFHIVPNLYYYPIPDTRALEKHDFNKLFDIESINLNDQNILKLLKSLSKYKDEYSNIFLKNSNLTDGDDALLYSMIRYIKPNKIIEIGGGYSTRISSIALNKNGQGKLLCIEPYPSEFLLGYLKENAGNVELIKKPLEEVDLRYCQELCMRNF